MMLALSLLIQKYLSRQRAINELYNLSDRELSDIGITRGEIMQVTR